MKKFVIVVFGLLIIGYLSTPYIYKSVFKPTTSTLVIKTVSDPSQISVVADDLNVPWDVARLPDGNLLVTERPGDLLLIDTEVGLLASTTVPAVYTAGEGGLMGIVLHPNFSQNQLVYLYRTTQKNSQRINQVVNYIYNDDHTLTDETIIIDDIPGATYHDGGAISFGPDGYLYIATGDAGRPELARDLNSIAGKILRVTDTGEPAPDNPQNSMVYSIGHRNPQGLAWDRAGRLWSTEHGRSGVQSGFDELNLIIPGGDYGWPESQGDKVLPGTIGPVLHSGAKETWAPGSLTAYEDILYFTGLRGQKLYRVTDLGSEIPTIVAYLDQVYGRLRAARVFDDTLYLTTSNRDGRGQSSSGDDLLLAVPLQILP